MSLLTLLKWYTFGLASNGRYILTVDIDVATQRLRPCIESVSARLLKSIARGERSGTLGGSVWVGGDAKRSGGDGINSSGILGRFKPD